MLKVSFTRKYINRVKPHFDHPKMTPLPIGLFNNFLYYFSTQKSDFYFNFIISEIVK